MRNTLEAREHAIEILHQQLGLLAEASKTACDCGNSDALAELSKAMVLIVTAVSQ